MSHCLLAVLFLAALALALPRTDRHGDPLPDGAMARVGTVRYRIGTVGPYALSPDGRTLAVETSCQITLWDVETGRPVRRVRVAGHGTDQITPRPLAFSPDGDHLVRVLSRDLRVFDARTGELRHTIGLPNPAWAVGFFPRTSRFAVIGAERRVWVYDARTGLCVDERRTEDGADSLSPDGRSFLGIGLVMDAATGRVTARFSDEFLVEPVYALAAAGGRLYAFTSRGFLYAFDTATGKAVERLLRPPGWKLYPGPVGLALSPDGTVAYLSQKGQPTFRRDLRAGQWLDPLPAMPGGRVLPHPDGKRLLLVGTDGLLRRYDLTTLRELPPPDGFADHLAAVPAPGGRFVATVSGDESPRLDLFDDTGKLLWSDRSLDWWPTLHWSPDGRRLVTLARNGVTLRDPATGKPDRVLARPPGDGPFAGLAAFPAGGRRLIAPFPNGDRVAVYDLAGGDPPAVIPTGVRGKPAISPDGKTLAVGGARQAPTVVDLTAGQVRPAPADETPDGDPYLSEELAFSPDGGYLLTWRPPGVAVLRDPTTGKAGRRFQIGDRRMRTCAFSPDGLWLAAGSTDGRVAVWDVRTGQQLWAGDGHRDAVTRVAFAGPGRLVSSSQDRTALLWDLRPDGPPTRSPWAALTGTDPLEAYRAVWALADDAAAPALLRDKIGGFTTAAQVKRWLTDLDADRYAVREAASRALRDRARSVEPDLQAARATATSEEVRARLDALLTRLTPERTAAEVVHARAVTALELAGTEAARKVLAEWASGPPAARLTADARAALERLPGR